MRGEGWGEGGGDAGSQTPAACESKKQQRLSGVTDSRIRMKWRGGDRGYLNSPVDRQFITEVLMIPISKQKQSIKAQQLVSRGEILQEELWGRRES